MAQASGILSQFIYHDPNFHNLAIIHLNPKPLLKVDGTLP
jgi:hypothetical protein